MTEIKSNLTSAAEKATAIQNAVNRLSQVNKGALDERSTIVGNQLAHETILYTQTVEKQICILVADAIRDLQSVATDFEVFDEEMAKQLMPKGSSNQ